MGVTHLKEIVLKGRRVVKGRTEGEALVSKDRISFWGSVDPKTGIVHERGHDLKEQCIKNRILTAPRTCTPLRVITFGAGD